MKPKRIFLDIDDVLNLCTTDALRYVGCPIDDIRDLTVINPKYEYNITAIANALMNGKRVFTESLFWQFIKRDFWANIPPSDECYWLKNLCCELVGAENVILLSSPTLDPDCLAGKLEWIQRFWPKKMQQQYLIGLPKWVCARPDALLIDDRDKNISEFHAAGGYAVLMPRPWNHLHYIKSTMEYITDYFSWIF